MVYNPAAENQDKDEEVKMAQGPAPPTPLSRHVFLTGHESDDPTAGNQPAVEVVHVSSPMTPFMHQDLPGIQVPADADENQITAEVPQGSSPPTPVQCGMTAWHWIILLIVPLITVLEASIPHSFGTIVAVIKSRNNMTSIIGLEWVTAVTSSLPCVLLQICLPLVVHCEPLYRYAAMLGCTATSLSCLASSFVVNPLLYFVTYTLIYGVGECLIKVAVVALLSDYFPHGHRMHVLATSLFQIGYPLAAGICNPLLATLIKTHGLQSTFRMVAVIHFVVGLPLGVLLKPPSLASRETRQPNAADNDETKPRITFCSRKQLTDSPEVWPWLLAKFFNYTFWFALRTNIVLYVNLETNFGLQRSANLMTVYASGEIAIALISSIFGNYFRGHLLIVHIVSAASMAVLTFVWPVIGQSNYATAVIIALLTGIAIQLTLSYGYPASAEVTQFDMRTAWAITNVAAGLGIVMSPVVGAVVIDKVSRPAIMFYVQGAGWCVQVILYAVCKLIMSCVLCRKKQTDST